MGIITAVVRSHAKVNLTLGVLGVRPDGYHDIESVMQSISLHDRVTLSVGGEPGIRIECDVPGIPTDERNLAHKAAALLLKNREIDAGLDIRIEKRIPAQAGLGGGSSNAAAVLMGLAGLLEMSIGQAELCDLASAVGSDVPFFIVGGIALVGGRGEEVQPLPDIPAQWLVILKPSFGVSTPWAYRRLDEIRGAVSERSTATVRMTKCIQAGDRGAIQGLLSNDLELPAIEQHPEIGELKHALLDAGAVGALMCGSGSAVFGLFSSEQAARGAADLFASPELQVFVGKTTARRDAADIWIVP